MNDSFANVAAALRALWARALIAAPDKRAMESIAKLDKALDERAASDPRASLIDGLTNR